MPDLFGRTILQIIPELNAGGAERTTVDIAEALVAAGARALVACEGGRLVSELQARGGLWIPFAAKTKNPLRMALNVRKLQAIIRRERVDLVHARSRAPAWVALVAAKRAGVPFVTTYHGAYAGTSTLKVQYNSVMARGDVVIANSQFTRDRIVEMHPFAKERIVVIHRGADLRAFQPDQVAPARVQTLRRAWGVEPDERIVLLAARLTSWKGQRVLIDAAKALKERGLQGVSFILAGDEQGRTGYAKELDDRIAAAGLNGIVRRVGHCADMPAAFQAADVVCVPSIEPEAFGRSAVEAQAMGVPVVVTNIGAAPETVLAPPQAPESERTGWRVPPDDVQALVEALAQMLALGASQRDALASRARRHVESHFSVEKMCARTLSIYEQLFAAR
ncbi:MAG: glycosyltransferase family 4 protein [Beijerinckiaceae bacterium]|nr:glycosyltransferase family 4 protein [Beijerinckiaceae bacterium]